VGPLGALSWLLKGCFCRREPPICVQQAPGNGEAFLDLVQRLTGAPLGSAAWVKELQVGQGGELLQSGLVVSRQDTPLVSPCLHFAWLSCHTG